MIINHLFLAYQTNNSLAKIHTYIQTYIFTQIANNYLYCIFTNRHIYRQTHLHVYNINRKYDICIYLENV